MVLELSDRFVLIPFNPIILQLTNQSGMIKFFRKIRQQLLSENRFTKYLIYAVGEIGIDTPPAAIANAIYNATGVRITTLPITPEKILKALKAKK